MARVTISSCWASALLCLSLLQGCGGGGGSDANAFSGPVARPSAAATATVGDTVALDASSSTVLPGGTTRYSWVVLSPTGGSVALVDSSTASPWFVATSAGAYTAILQVAVAGNNYAATSAAVSTLVTVSAAPTPSATEVRARIQSLAASAAPYADPDSSSPSVQAGAKGGDSQLAGSQLVTWDNPVFRYTGDVRQAGSVYPDYLFGSNQAVSYSATQFSGNALAIDFDIDAAAFEVFQKGLGYNSRLRVVVDGRLANSTPVEHPLDGGLYLTRVSFASKAKRHVRLLTNSPYFGGIRLLPSDKLTRSTVITPLRTMFVGDSITEGPAGQAAQTSYAGRAAELLGWTDAWLSGVGATGYLAAPSPKLTFRQRYAQDVLPYAPQVLVIAGGINDAGASDSAIQAEASALFDLIQADLPQTLVFVTGPWATIGRVRSGVNASLKAAVGTRTNFIWVPNVDDSWLTGTGNAGSPKGDGNADAYVSADTTHPTPAGIEYLAEKFRESVKNASR